MDIKIGFFKDFISFYKKNYKNLCIIDDKNKKSNSENNI